MISIATWNVQNLFLPGGDDGPRTPEDYAAKIDGLAATISAAQVDVVGVQEVGSPQAFDDLRARLGGTWTGVLSTQPGRREIRVGVLSRLPVVRVSDDVRLRAGLPPLYVDDTRDVVTRMSRGALTVEVTAPSGLAVRVVVVHLKSKLITYPGGRFDTTDEAERARFAAYALFQRTSEAVTVRGIADRLLAGRGQERAVAVVGDLNDEPLAATTQILQGPPGSEFGTPAADRPDKGDAHRLFNPGVGDLWRAADGAVLPVEERYTRRFGQRGELIDHVLVSHRLRAAVRAVRVVREAPLPDMATTPPSTPTVAKPWSDHALLAVDLDA